MKRLLLVTHNPSTNLSALAQAAFAAATEDCDGLAVEQLRPLDCNPDDILTADGLMIGTCENLGALAGLTKDLFDRCYYPVLEAKQGMPVAAYIRAGQDGTGATRQLQTITTGLRWRWAAEPLVLRGEWSPNFLTQVAQLSAGFAIGVEQGIF